MKGRTTIEVVILVFAVTVCGFLLLAGAGLTILAILQPGEASAREPLETALTQAVTTIIGALLGLVAGRAQSQSQNNSTSNNTVP